MFVQDSKKESMAYLILAGLFILYPFLLEFLRPIYTGNFSLNAGLVGLIQQIVAGLILLPELIWNVVAVENLGITLFKTVSNTGNEIVLDITIQNLLGGGLFNQSAGFFVPMMIAFVLIIQALFYLIWILVLGYSLIAIALNLYDDFFDSIPALVTVYGLFLLSFALLFIFKMVLEV